MIGDFFAGFKIGAAVFGLLGIVAGWYVRDLKQRAIEKHRSHWK